MKVKWYGTATLMLESGGTRLLVDPYARRCSRAPGVDIEEARTADAILITHPHLDHFADVDIFSRDGESVYVSESGIELARRNGLAAHRMAAIAAGDEVRIGAFTVRAYPARHCRFDAATLLRLALSPRPWARLPQCVRLLRAAARFRIDERDVLAYAVDDGERRVLIFGSAGMDADADYPRAVDLLVFPYQGRRRMDREMIPFLRALEPRAVMLDHFDDAFPPVTHRVDTRRFLPTLAEYAPDATGILPTLNEWTEI